MKILIICSKAFYKDIAPIEEKLKEMGHEVELPNSYYEPDAEKKSWDLGPEEHSKFKARMFKMSAERIETMDAVLTLNFDKNGKKVLFSGGALYKTIGGGNKFYNIVSKVLENNSDTIFLYAGFGDDTELVKLSEIYNGRVFHIQERKDLFALMTHVDAYLNTYPMIGGLMTQYAAKAGLPPIILIDEGKTDASGLLLDQDKANIEFHKVEDVVSEISRLLQDLDYRKQRALDIKTRVFSENDFTLLLSEILYGKSKRCYANCPDTKNFRKEYISRFNLNMVVTSIVTRKNRSLTSEFPGLLNS